MLEGLIAAGFYSCFYGSGRGAVRTGIGAARQWEQLFLVGGVWLMVCSLAEFGTGNVLLPIEPLQTALVLAMLFRVGCSGVVPAAVRGSKGVE